MFKWILLLAVLYALYRMIDSERRKKAEKTRQDTQHLVATGELIKDPVCGAYVDRDSAISVREGDTIHRFCGYDCRDAFLRQRGLPPEANPGNKA